MNLKGELANKHPVDTLERLKDLLADSGGKKYYAELEHLDVDVQLLQKTLKTTCASRTRTWLSLCSHCGMCAESCLFFRCNNNDPKQIPAYKIQSTLGEILRKNGRVDNAFMRRAMDIAWSNCTGCNRCSQFCPYGIDTGVMFSYLRGLLFQQGFVPWELKIGSGMNRIYGAQMDVSTEEWLETCSWMEEENEDLNLSIPIDKEGADLLYTLNAREPKHYPEEIAQAALLFQLAGENWTVPATGWDQTSLAMFAGDWEACRQNVERVYASIARLKPKRVLGTECGHAHRATVIEGPYWAGLEDGKPPVEYLHFVEWLAEALRTGKLKIDPAKKIRQKTTIQDACNYVRNYGLGATTREIASYIIDDGYLVEMQDNHELNHCCGGGGGLNGIGIYREARNKALQVKRDQILATGAELVISPCHNCLDAINAIKDVYGLEAKVSLLKPLILGMLKMPELG